MAVMTLIEDDRQWFKSSLGFGDISETCRRNSFCSWSLLSAAPECLVVPNALTDPRFAGNPFVANPPALRSYIGSPLVASGGARIGTLCLLDVVPRHFTAQDCALLCNCAEIAVRELEAWHADARLAFAAPATEGEALRSAHAWDVGILVVTIRAHPHALCCVLGFDHLRAA